MTTLHPVSSTYRIHYSVKLFLVQSLIALGPSYPTLGSLACVCPGRNKLYSIIYLRRLLRPPFPRLIHSSEQGRAARQPAYTVTCHKVEAHQQLIHPPPTSSSLLILVRLLSTPISVHRVPPNIRRQLRYIKQRHTPIIHSPKLEKKVIASSPASGSHRLDQRPSPHTSKHQLVRLE